MIVVCCPHCDGTGDEFGPGDCGWCDGTGSLPFDTLDEWETTVGFRPRRHLHLVPSVHDSD